MNGGKVGRKRSGGLLLARRSALEHPHYVALLHDQIFDSVDLDLGAGPLAKQHAVAGLDVDGDELAVLVTSPGADRDHLALRGLLLGGVGNDDAAGAALLGIDALDDNAIVKRAKLHGLLLKIDRQGLGWSGRRKLLYRRAAWPPHRAEDFWPQGPRAKFLALLWSECYQFL